jgi:hypothetical protein
VVSGLQTVSTWCEAVCSGEGGVEVGKEVVNGFESDGEASQTILAERFGAGRGGTLGVLLVAGQRPG